MSNAQNPILIDMIVCGNRELVDVIMNCLSSCHMPIMVYASETGCFKNGYFRKISKMGAIEPRATPSTIHSFDSF